MRDDVEGKIRAKPDMILVLEHHNLRTRDPVGGAKNQSHHNMSWKEEKSDRNHTHRPNPWSSVDMIA